MSTDIPSQVRTTVALAERYYAAGLGEQARENLEPLIGGAAPHILHLCASVCYEAGDLAHAQTLCAQVLAVSPADAGSLLLHGRILLDLGQTSGAVTALRAAVAAKPEHAPTHFNLGLALERAGVSSESITAYRAAIARDEAYPEAWNNLGLALERAGDSAAAVAAFQMAIRHAPAFHAAAANLAALLIDQGHLAAAIRTATSALEQDATNVEACINLGVALLERARHGEAQAAFAAAQSLAPDHKDAGDNAVYLNHYMSNDPAAVMTAHAAWGARFAPVAGPRLRRSVAPDRQRIGYVSPDFRRHSVAFFVEPLLAHHDRKKFEVFCYASGRSDGVTSRLKGLVDHWRDITSLGDEAAARLIAEDGIDILVDLAGHTKGNRLGLFRLGAAPVQITALGYPGTTGLPQMDFRLCDAVTDPCGSDAFASETLIRLPQLHCYQPPLDAPDVAALPAIHNGFITFGSFNKLGKVSDAAVALWAQVLTAIPTAHLFLKSRGLVEEETRAFTAARFAARGIATTRLDLVGWMPDDAGHLVAYNKIDIALDTFPYSGTTTTCEALWMGVPMLTLAGATHASRVTASLLASVGLDTWSTQSQQEFFVRARAAADDLSSLTDLRAGLRARVRASPLCDGASYAAAVEAAYRGMWARSSR
jgi:predicted O-linked N-acetylglucosamine transferase (SPINDLY family)